MSIVGQGAKSVSEDDTPTQQPMRAGTKIPRNPSTDQKKIRHQIARQGSQDGSISLNAAFEALAAPYKTRNDAPVEGGPHCPECGSSDIDITDDYDGDVNGNTKCGACGAGFTFDEAIGYDQAKALWDAAHQNYANQGRPVSGARKVAELSEERKRAADLVWYRSQAWQAPFETKLVRIMNESFWHDDDYEEVRAYLTEKFGGGVTASKTATTWDELQAFPDIPGLFKAVRGKAVLYQKDPGRWVVVKGQNLTVLEAPDGNGIGTEVAWSTYSGDLADLEGAVKSALGLDPLVNYGASKTAGQPDDPANLDPARSGFVDADEQIYNDGEWTLASPDEPGPFDDLPAAQRVGSITPLIARRAQALINQESR